MFQRLQFETRNATVTIMIDGKSVTAREGDTVAAAILAAGIDRFRMTPISGAPRAAYCMMGACFDCLVTINGVGNRQGCTVRVHEGMRIEVQHGKREIGR